MIYLYDSTISTEVQLSPERLVRFGGGLVRLTVRSPMGHRVPTHEYARRPLVPRPLRQIAGRAGRGTMPRSVAPPGFRAPYARLSRGSESAMLPCSAPEELAATGFQPIEARSDGREIVRGVLHTRRPFAKGSPQLVSARTEDCTDRAPPWRRAMLSTRRLLSSPDLRPKQAVALDYRRFNLHVSALLRFQG